MQKKKLPQIGGKVGALPPLDESMLSGPEKAVSTSMEVKSLEGPHHRDSIEFNQSQAQDTDRVIGVMKSQEMMH